jgi:hypothetical protein
MNIVRYVAFFLFLLLSACTNADDSLPHGIREAVENYYQAEMVGDWEKVYTYRTDEFRKHVMKDEFVKVMLDSSLGWKLDSFEIKGFQTNSDKVILKMAFKEEPPKSFWVGSGVKDQKSIMLLEEAVWTYKENKWFCDLCPSRGHLPYSK